MRILVTPDKFKGALSAADAAEAIARGVSAVHPGAQVVRCPMADGGEGTVAALIAATGGHLVRELVTGPLPHMQVDAEFGITGDGQTAVIEMAAASGLALVPDHLRDPCNTTTYGTGQLMRLAANMGVKRIILGIGGSATVDGGIGALQALGARFTLNGDNFHGEPLVGRHLAQISGIKAPQQWNLPEILIACDVENPLCGPEGAAAVFGPQKGATPQQVAELDGWLGNLARVLNAAAIAASAGSGAAGGLGFGLRAMVPNVRMAGGFSLVSEACDFEGKLRDADLCITAEGRFDQSSLKGKTAVGVTRTCEKLNVPCLILAGSVEPDAEKQVKAVAAPIVNGPMSLADAMRDTAQLLEQAARRMVRAMTSAIVLAAVSLCTATTDAQTPPAAAPALGHFLSPEGNLVIRAKFMRSPVTEHKTRLLADLKGFETKPATLDKFGGIAAEKHEATGFFHSKKVGDRWWLIDPEGHRFIHMGVCSVSPGSSPQMKRAFPAAFGTKDSWRDKTQAMLADLGFNGTGCWSDDALLQSGQKRSAYTPVINFMSSYAKKKGITHAEPGHTGYKDRCIPVFDAAFPAFCDELARQCAARKDDPWLLGYYTDNELPFEKGALDRYLKLEDGNEGRLAAEKWLADKAIKEVTPDAREAFLAFVVDRYLSTVCAAIRKHDPNHMILGPRFHGEVRGSKLALPVVGKHLDAIAVNIYGNWDGGYECARIANMAGKPVIVTEWYAKAVDSGLPNTTGAGWLVETQQDRAAFYEHFTLTLLEQRGCVGWHWFKYLDNDPEDTKAELSNRDANKGMLKVTYEPYAPLVESMSRINRAAYQLADWFDAQRGSSTQKVVP